MIRNLKWTVVLAGAAMMGCGGGGGDDHTEDAHEVSAQYAGEIGSADVAHGEEVYGQVCGVCHNGGAPNLENLGWDAGHMRQQVREGEDRMPPISAARVSDEDLEAVLAYLTTIGAVTGELPGGAAPAEPATEGGEEAAPADDAGEAEATDA